MLTEEQRAQRVIGGSTISKILGQSRFGTPADAYEELKGGAPQKADSEDLDRGNFLEPGIRRMTSKRLGIQFYKPATMFKHPTHSFATYWADGIARDNPTDLLEVKAPGKFSAGLWGDPESKLDDVPPDVYLQAAWGLAVTNRSTCYVAALIMSELKVFTLARDTALEKVMFDKAQAFMENHVYPGIPPPPTFGDSEVIKRRWPKSELPVMKWSEMSLRQRVNISNYLALRSLKKTNEKALETTALAVKDLIGLHAGIVIDDPAEVMHLGFSRIDYKNNKDGAKTEWESVARALAEDCGAISELERLIQFHTVAVPGNRPLFPRP